MLIIADKKLPEKALHSLKKYGELVLLETNGITEESISGHPDIFFYQTTSSLIVAPNLPADFKKILSLNKITFSEGYLPVEDKYPAAARYNAVYSKKLLIHNLAITDNSIFENAKELNKISVRQGFTRCSLLPLNNGFFITSDRGIEKKLNAMAMKALYVSPTPIILQGQKHGLFGGTCGIFQDKVFIAGNLDFMPESQLIRSFIFSSGMEVIELYDGPIYDGGSIIFVEKNT